MALSFTEGSIGGDIERIDLDQLRAFYSGKHGSPLRLQRRRVDERQGSNGIAIAPKLTSDGQALLLINPHTSFYFRSELQMTSDEGSNAYGAATWGQFFIYQGFNPHAGWMHTSSGVDSVDEFAEKIERHGKGAATAMARSAGRSASGRSRSAIAPPDGSSPREDFTTWRTHHGPIVRCGERPLDRVRDDGQAGRGAAAKLSADQGQRPRIVHAKSRSSRRTARTTRSSPTTRARSPTSIRSSSRAATTGSTIRGRSTAATRAPTGAALHALSELPSSSGRPTAGS